MLQTAFLADRWGAQAILGLEPDIFTLMQISQLLNVYTIFKKSSKPGMLKQMTDSERKLMARIMALSAEDD